MQSARAHQSCTESSTIPKSGSTASAVLPQERHRGGELLGEAVDFFHGAGETEAGPS